MKISYLLDPTVFLLLSIGFALGGVGAGLDTPTNPDSLIWGLFVFASVALVCAVIRKGQVGQRD